VAVTGGAQLTVALAVLVAVALVAVVRAAVQVAAVVVVSGAIGAGSETVLPYAAQVIGGAMIAASLAGGRMRDDVGAGWDQVEGWLALRATRRQAVAAIGRRAVARALVLVGLLAAQSVAATLTVALLGPTFVSRRPIPPGTPCGTTRGSSTGTHRSPSAGSEDGTPRKDPNAGEDQDQWNEERPNAAAVTGWEIENTARYRPGVQTGRHQHAQCKNDRLRSLRLCHDAIIPPAESRAGLCP